MMKWGLLLIALFLLGLLIAWPFIHPAQQETLVATSVPGKPEEVKKSIMEKPHFQGVDSQNHPYSITAEKAEQSGPDKVVLVNVVGDITLEEEKHYSLSANKGVYEVARSNLTLEGQVILLSSDGLDVRTESAFINVNQGTVQGPQAVSIKSSWGTLVAKSFLIKERGNIVEFSGPVKVVVTNGKGNN